MLALSELRSELKGFFTSAKTANDEVAALTAKLATATATIAARDTIIGQLQEAAKVATAAIDKKDGEMATLTDEIASEKKRANAVLAAQGLPAGSVPEATADEPGKATATAWETYNRLMATNPRAAGEFYLANADKVLGSRK